MQYNLLTLGGQLENCFASSQNWTEWGQIPIYTGLVSSQVVRWSFLGIGSAVTPSALEWEVSREGIFIGIHGSYQQHGTTTWQVCADATQFIIFEWPLADS